MTTVSIPAFHVSDKSRARGVGEIFIQSRRDAVSSGKFAVRLEVKFDPALDLYPFGSLVINTALSDGARGSFTATSIELINSYRKHSPTGYNITGRCNNAIQPYMQ